MDIQGTISRVPTWGWAVGGVLLVGLVFLTTQGGGGQSAITPAVPAADTNDILAQLQNAADQLGSKSAPTTTPTTFVKKIIGYTGVVPSRQPINLYDKNRKFVKTISGLTLQFDQKIKIGGKWWYRIKSGKYQGMFIRPGSNITITPIYSSPPSPTTTQSTSTVPTGNNQVSS